jgi:competence protein ComFC
MRVHLCGASQAIQLAASAALDLIYPRVCSICRADISGVAANFCTSCWEKLSERGRNRCVRCATALGPHVRNDSCPTCRKRSFGFDRAVTAGAYDGPVRDLVLQLKYGKNMRAAVPLAALMCRRAREVGLADGVDVVTAVPLTRLRYAERGFNQAELLARKAASVLGLLFLSRLIRRSRSSAPQTGLTREERIRNARGTFEVQNRDAVRGRTIILVDDVMTTGSTVSECARVLMKSGAKSVRVLVAARD